MKTIPVSANSKTLNALLKKARRRSVILEAVDGERFMLTSIKNWEAFEVGPSADFGVEVRRTAKNKKLAKAMAKRRELNQDKPRRSLAEVREELELGK